MFAYAILMIGIIAAHLLMLGWHSRSAALFTWLVWVSLWNRNPLLLDGDDAILKMMCFYLMLSPCGNCWSLDAHLNHKPEWVSVWPLRLMQFQIALLYFVSGWVKFHSPEWLDGTVLQIILIHPQYSRFDGWNMIHNFWVSEILSGLAWFIRWWELVFPLLLLNVYTRRLNLSCWYRFPYGFVANDELTVVPNRHVISLSSTFIKHLL